MDEDPLDGRDNDGDGRIDEDFAAISDAMVVVDGGPGGNHTEFYHWAYSRLMSAVFFTLSGEPDPAGLSDYQFGAPGGQWQEAEVSGRRHSMVGRPGLDHCTARVARVSGYGSRSGAQNPDVWVGVMILGSDSGRFTPSRFASDRDRLDLVHQGSASMVACVAESWLQLNRLLCEARRVYDGVVDPVSGSRTSWIVPPLCSLCLQAGNPAFSWSLAGEEDLLLNIDIKKGRTALADPDLFLLAGTPLGSPVEILWKPARGEARAVRWTRMTPALLQDPVKSLNDPFGEFPTLLDHDAEGELSFRFMIQNASRTWGERSVADGAQPRFLRVEGRWLDGRHLQALAEGSSAPRAMIEMTMNETSASAEPAELIPVRNQDPGSRNLVLATDLLRGWPNPFREAIQVRFRIPRTIGEAFQQDEDHQLPAGMELRAPVPWETGAPYVTIKIYRINGQELITLHQDYSSSGETTVQWDGTDNYGRRVASGPYFCKLQMDDWSVTRRIVFVR